MLSINESFSSAIYKNAVSIESGTYNGDECEWLKLKDGSYILYHVYSSKLDQAYTNIISNKHMRFERKYIEVYLKHRQNFA